MGIVLSKLSIMEVQMAGQQGLNTKNMLLKELTPELDVPVGGR